LYWNSFRLPGYSVTKHTHENVFEIKKSSSYSAWKSTRTGFAEARTLFRKSSLSFTSNGVLKYDVVVMCADVPERYFGENNAL